jgi:hypothetical protein
MVYLGCEAGSPNRGFGQSQRNGHLRERFSGVVDSKDPAGTRPAWDEILQSGPDGAPEDGRPPSTFDYYINDLVEHQLAVQP